MVPVFVTDGETKRCECQFMKLKHWLQSSAIKVLWDIPDDRRSTQVVNPLWQMYRKFVCIDVRKQTVRQQRWRGQWGYRWSWNTSSTSGTRPFGTIRPSLVLSCKLNDSKTGAQWNVVSSPHIHRIWFSTGCTSPSKLCYRLLLDWNCFAKSKVTTHQILFLHATFSRSKNIFGSPNKILIYEAKKTWPLFMVVCDKYIHI